MALVRATLSAVADNDDKYLANRLADRAIAAAAVAAFQLPGGETLVTPYAPNFLLEGGTLDVAGDIAAWHCVCWTESLVTNRNGETCGKTPAGPPKAGPPVPAGTHWSGCRCLRRRRCGQLCRHQCQRW